jgi:hypothetical protein
MLVVDLNSNFNRKNIPPKVVNKRFPGRHMCPYWQVKEERELIDMVEQGKTLEELAKHFKRSPEAIRMKIRRLGLDLREQNKVTTSTTTHVCTEPITPAEELPSPEEALKLWWGAIQRLNQPGLSVGEVKRLRLLLSALKAYVVRIIPVFERILVIEKRLEDLRRSLLEYYKTELSKAETEEERRRWRKIINEFGEVEDTARQDRLLRKVRGEQYG